MELLNPPGLVIFHVSEATFPSVYANARGEWIVKHADDTLDGLDNWLAFPTLEAARAAALSVREAA